MSFSDNFFANTYFEARDKFLELVSRAGGKATSFENQTVDTAQQDTLATDVALLKSERDDESDSSSVLVLLSATHGVEGYCGSAIQNQFLENWTMGSISRAHPIILVHAINPFGMAHYRRVNEDNVDLNRNFVDFRSPLPKNPGYEQLHSALVPKMWFGTERDQAEAKIRKFTEENGQRAFQAAVVGGQFQNSDGLFFGGSSPVWSNRTWHSIIRKHIRRYQQIAVIDFHTGLGPNGYGEPLFIGHAESSAYQSASNWYGSDLTCPGQDGSASTSIQGPLLMALVNSLPKADVIAIALEFGTYPIERVLKALRADNWLSHYGDSRSELGIQIKQEIREAFYPKSEIWKTKVLSRANEVIRQALSGLGENN